MRVTEETPEPAHADAASWRAVRLAASVTVVTAVPIFLVGATSVQVRAELVFSTTALGALVAVFRIGAASSSSVLGRVTDRIGSVRAMRYALLIGSFSTFGIAFFARSWTGLAIGILGCGAASSWGQLAANRYLIRVVRDGRQGLAFGIKQAAVPMAAMIAGLSVPLVALTLGWRAAFIITASVALLLVPFLPRPVGPARTGPQQSTPKVQFRGSIRVLTFGLMFAMAAGATLGAFTVETGVARGLSVSAASLMLTVGSLVSIVLRVVIGRLSDMRKDGHFEFVSGLLLVGALGYLLMGVGGPSVLLVAIPVAFGAGWAFNGLFWYAALRLRSDAPGATAGVIMPGGMAGGVFGPPLFGAVAERFGYGAAWALVAGFAVAAATLIRIGSRMNAAEQASAVADRGPEESATDDG